MENLPSDHFVALSQFVKTVYRDVYPSIDPRDPSNSQAGKVIVITGASRGIGRMGFANSFAHAAPKGIVLTARSAEELTEVEHEIHAINREIDVLVVPTDLSDVKAVASLWEKVESKFGHADVLINNAGTGLPGPLADMPADSWWMNFDINVRGSFLNTQGFLKILGKERKGTIVNVTSGAAILVLPGMSSYSLSKLVDIQIQAFVAVENPNVTAVALAPGIILTQMVTEWLLPFAKDTPELAGGMGVWLATDKAAFLNGKYVEANWSVDDLTARKDEIVSEGKLSMVLKGDFGRKQFE